jgi:para-aminobenzoate synthetase / 4-amino-4-deoxychorismate lyase
MSDPDRIRARLDFEGQRLRFGRPSRICVARALDEVIPALEVVAAAARGGQHAVGFVAYNAAPAFDRALQVRAPASSGAELPLLWFGIYEPNQVHLESGATTRARPLHAYRAQDNVTAERDRDAADSGADCGTPAAALPPLTFDTGAEEHAAAVGSIRAAIAAGDVYQVNYTLRCTADAAALPAQLLRAWRRGQGAGYFADIDLGRLRIVSLSPELFFSVRGREITTRPMKGTARRGRWPEEDDAAAARLAASEKDRAENLMIVDLMRNDLGRIARFGSVRVPRLFEVERYPTVHQMTSTITAQLREGIELPDILRALFPCGSVTGAPKVAAMRAIARLERTARGVYCGSIGHVEPGGNCTFNVAIRTLVSDAASGRLTYGVGGGITWDSNAASEYDEAHAKAEVIRRPRRAFALLETMVLEGGMYPHLAGHMARLTASAAYFGWRLDRRAIDAALATEATAEGRWRVRLLVHEDGSVRIERTPLTVAASPLRVRLVEGAVHSGDVFLYHKTTRREAYDAARARAGAFDEALLTNERGELTELTTGNLVAELVPGLYTPPRASGLLCGVFREELLRSGTIVERVLRPADLGRAQRCWLVNAVRGWRPITSVEADGELLFASVADRAVPR